MVNYSVTMKKNPRDPEAPKKAYGNAQYSEVMTLERFADHITTHGCVYSRADIVAILLLAVDCMREQLLAGQRIELGDLGRFYLTLNSTGADKASDYDPYIHVKRINVKWSCGERFQNLLQDAQFNLVATRLAAKLVVKALKAGDKTVTLVPEEEGDGDLAA